MQYWRLHPQKIGTPSGRHAVETGSQTCKGWCKWTWAIKQKG